MRIGVVRYWADRPAAEHEVIARLTTAAASRGHQVVDLHPDGSPIDASADDAHDVDLVINLHFASPKCLDVPHVGPLWNPVRFYHHFGFKPHFANQLTHDYLASCGSRVVDAAFAPFRPELFRAGLPILNHTVPERYIEPRLQVNRAVFYVGVNWERMSGGPGRHDALLRILDDRGLSAIHGPEVIDGIRPWGGFATYRGQLPFDGWSVVESISEAGAALIVSSSEHYRDGVMSCRPFEAAAAGVPLISERHPFMVEHFADCAVFFDERAPAQEQGEEVAALIRRLNDDPEYALDLASRAQAVVRERFNLDEQLDQLCTWVAQQEASRRRPAKVKATAVVVPVRGLAATEEWLARNAKVLSTFTEVVIAPPDLDASWGVLTALLDTASRVVVGTRSDTTWSERAACATADLSGPLCFVTTLEELWERYPHEVAAAEGDVRILPAVARADLEGEDDNARTPTLLCGQTTGWWNFPVASVVVSAEYLRSLRRALGPGSHLAVAAETGLARDVEAPQFEPAFTVRHSEARVWSLDSFLGEERKRDSDYAHAHPGALEVAVAKSVYADPGRPDEDAKLLSAQFVLPESAIRIGTGFSFREGSGGTRWWWAIKPVATLVVSNSSEDPRVGSFAFTLGNTPGSPHREVRIQLPGNQPPVAVPVLGQKVTLQVSAEPGAVSTITLTVSGDSFRPVGDDRDLWFQFKEPTLLRRYDQAAPTVAAAPAEAHLGANSALTFTRDRPAALSSRALSGRVKGWLGRARRTSASIGSPSATGTRRARQ